MKDKLIKTEWKHKIRVYAYQSKILELTNSNIPFLCQSGYRGYIGISHQLHPLKTKVEKTAAVVPLLTEAALKAETDIFQAMI